MFYNTLKKLGLRPNQFFQRVAEILSGPALMPIAAPVQAPVPQPGTAAYREYLIKQLAHV